MPFLLLLVLTLISLQREWPQPPQWAGMAGGIALTWAGVALFLGQAWVSARRTRHQLSADTADRATLLRRHASHRRRHAVALIVFYLIAVCALGWGWVARDLISPGGAVTPGVELLMLAPLLAGLLLSWAVFYDVERAVHAASPFGDEPPFPTRWAYVGVQARHNLLLIVPPLVLMFVQQTALWLFPQLQHDEVFLGVFGAVLLLGVFVGIPWLLRLVLGLRPLPDGPLRDRLLAAARRLHFRFSDLLVWDTRHSVANAMVTGPLPWLRYVVLTDRLIRDMTPDEIEAVFGHEVGHIKHRHMLFYFGFLLASLVVVLGTWHAADTLVSGAAVQGFLREHAGGLMEWLKAYRVLALVPLLVLLGVYLFVVFGFLSRRCERQADIYGCRTVSCAVFIEALEKVARLNGISRDRPGWLSSWQHSTIARRVEFIQQMTLDPDVEPRFQRAVSYVKWGMALSLGAAFGILCWVLGTEEMLRFLRQM
jgi:Zn-dependent protease with chaperone function